MVSFQPSGSASGWWRFLNVLVGIAIFVSPWVVFALPDLTPWSGHGGIIDLSLVALVYGLLALIVVFTSAYIGLAMFRILQSNIAHKNE